MKQKLLFFLLISSQLLTAQNFIEAPDAPFEGVYWPTANFADIDGDGDQDVLITGRIESNPRSAKLYENDGQGNYTEISGTPFQRVVKGAVAFADVDGDDDQDVIITGDAGPFFEFAQLYLNDGSGNFSEVDTPFTGVVGSNVTFADVDNDDDMDLLLNGWTGFARISKLYINDGTAVFTESTDLPFYGVNGSNVPFADVDGDGDLDVLITGLTGNSSSGSGLVASLYMNLGDGTFIEASNVPFEKVRNSAIGFADVDNDNDLDVMITGLNENEISIAKLYTNDGNGNFSEVLNTPFTGINRGTIAFSDVDLDNDQDLIIAGMAEDETTITHLYLNDGNGNFSIEPNAPFYNARDSKIALADVNGDGKQDVLITGRNEANSYGATLYLNNTVLPAAPLALFTYLDQGLEVAFTDASANEPNSWAWDFGDGETSTEQNPVHVFENPGTYNVCLTVSNIGGNDTYCEEITLTTSTTKKIDSTLDIDFYPNPAQDVVTLELNRPYKDDISLKLYNTYGQVVDMQPLKNPSTQLELNLSLLPSGVYWLQIDIGGETLTQRLMVQ